MNKQIKRLARQAGAVTGTDLTNVTDALVLIGEEEIQTFGQLIIEECRNIIDDVYQTTSLELCGPLLTVDEKILNHFHGVENERTD